MENSVKRVLLAVSVDEISKGIVYNLAKSGCRLVLMGDEKELRAVVVEIRSKLKGGNQIEVVGLNMEEEREAVFDEAVDKGWKQLGGLDAFVNCHLYEVSECQWHSLDMQFGVPTKRLFISLHFMRSVMNDGPLLDTAMHYMLYSGNDLSLKKLYPGAPSGILIFTDSVSAHLLRLRS